MRFIDADALKEELRNSWIRKAKKQNKRIAKRRLKREDSEA